MSGSSSMGGIELKSPCSICHKVLTRNAATQNYSISVTANKDKFNTAIVLGYFRHPKFTNREFSGVSSLRFIQFSAGHA